MGSSHLEVRTARRGSHADHDGGAAASRGTDPIRRVPRRLPDPQTPGSPERQVGLPGADREGVAFVAVEGDVAAEIAEHPFGQPTFTGSRWPLADTRLLAPILPTKVVCVGKNYADHAREMGGEAPADPVIFLKPSTSVI